MRINDNVFSTSTSLKSINSIPAINNIVLSGEALSGGELDYL